MLNALQNPMMNNFAPGMGAANCSRPPQLEQMLESLFERIMDSSHMGPSEEHPWAGGSPVNFGAWNHPDSAPRGIEFVNGISPTHPCQGDQGPFAVNHDLMGGWNNLAAPTNTNSNSAPGAGGTTTVNINAKKIKNSNIIVNGQNVTANSGKKANVNGQ